MSTVPGQDAWRDAGLVDQQDDIVSLVEEVTTAAQAPATDREGYRPGTPRPDLVGDADEADVVEQAAGIVETDDERS